MAVIVGPKNERFVDELNQPHPERPFEVKSRVLGLALSEYEAHFNVRLTTDSGFDGQYFSYHDLEAGVTELVDIHLYRGDQEICLKQNLDVVLEPNDLIRIGQLIC